MTDREYPKRPIVGLGAVIVGPKGVVLIKRGKPPRMGAWSLPGGAQDLGETVKEGLIREVKEETGLDVQVLEIIDVVEKQASCELYGLLKRPDEKFVTERAYDNPKFVEDMVRDIATELKNDKRINSFVVESENFESIHNHSAYALIKS